MVLWEITLGTAYFLGLKRTYRLALKLQRRILGRKHPKIRHFLHGRTRVVFDVALKVHLNIQHRDIEVGRNLGNWILRCLDRMKPSAQIRGPSPVKHPNSANSNKNLTKLVDGANSNLNVTKEVTNSSRLKTPGNPSRSWESDRHLFTSSTNMWPKPFPTIAMMMRPSRLTGSIMQHRHLSFWGPEMCRSSYTSGTFGGVIRKDIMQWMLQN